MYFIRILLIFEISEIVVNSQTDDFNIDLEQTENKIFQ